MVEALSTGFQNLYNKYTRSDNSENVHQNDRREIYIVPVNTAVTNDQQQLLQRYRSKSRKNFAFDVKNLCQSKESKWQIMRLKKLRPFAGQCCPVCVPVRPILIHIFFFH